MKKRIWQVLTIVLVVMLSVSFVSCGGDDYTDDEKNSQKEKQEEKQEDIIDPYITPLTLEPIDGGYISVTNNALEAITCNLDNGESQIINSGEYKIFFVGKGCKVSIFGNNARYYLESYKYTSIRCTSDVYVYGNVMSLINSTNFASLKTLTEKYTFCRLFVDNEHLKSHPTKELVLPATTLTEGCYKEMFSGCKSLVRSPSLPATTLAKECYMEMFYRCSSLFTPPVLPATAMEQGCYELMFNYCTSLTTAPELPATIMAKDCYGGMFSNCINLINVQSILPATELSESCYSTMFRNCEKLTIAPKLPATTLQKKCYEYMFDGCVRLTDAPELLAKKLPDYCYYSMFNDCMSLKYVKCLATNIGYFSTYKWMENVSASGTFVKDKNKTWNIGSNGIPDNWTIENAE